MAASTVEGPVAHHFDNMGQQLATVRFGMWLFLITEVLFFGGAFCAYTAYRVWYPRDFEAGSAALNVGIASVNTFLLLTSSLTITLAIRSAYVGNRKGLMRNLLFTIVLGTAFLGLKAREYQIDYEEGLMPGSYTTMKPEAARRDAELRDALQPMVPMLDAAVSEQEAIAFVPGTFPRKVRDPLAFYKFEHLEKMFQKVSGKLNHAPDGFNENVVLALEEVHYKGERTDRIAPSEIEADVKAIRALKVIPSKAELEADAQRKHDKGEFNPSRVQLFFMFYYSMTGLHVLHMIIGLGLLTWQLIFAQMGFFDHKSRYVYVEVMSLYWHFVDMAWMFLLPLLYLCGPHTAGQAVEQFQMAIGLTHSGH